MFQIVVTEVDDSALFYRMCPKDKLSDVAYSGTAVNVDVVATQLERASSLSKDE
ncbi:MAG: hypothetical protein ACI89X_003711 [Planctomycetota bacterium]|jgi:hypothetical protein